VCSDRPPHHLHGSLPSLCSYEICTNGSIWDRLQGEHERHSNLATLTWAQRLGLAVGTARALAYLHTFNPPAVHRDIKSPNSECVAQ
jgi:serine/threonine protein kinase